MQIIWHPITSGSSSFTPLGSSTSYFSLNLFLVFPTEGIKASNVRERFHIILFKEAAEVKPVGNLKMAKIFTSGSNPNLSSTLSPGGYIDKCTIRAFQQMD